MNINVLIQTDIDSDFNYSMSILGVYTNHKRNEVEKQWVTKGKDLVPRHIHVTQEYYNDLKSGKIMSENIPAIQAMRKRRMEQYAHELGKLESIYTDEEYKNYYAKCLNLHWETYELFE